MSKDELTFVIGHELGHFLLGHSLEERQDTESEEYGTITNSDCNDGNINGIILS